MAAWRQKYPHHSVPIFVNYRRRINVPCPTPGATYSPSAMKDRFLFNHLRIFYDIARFEGGILEAIAPKRLSRIEVIDVSLRNNRFNTFHSVPCWVLLLTDMNTAVSS